MRACWHGLGEGPARTQEEGSAGCRRVGGGARSWPQKGTSGVYRAGFIFSLIFFFNFVYLKLYASLVRYRWVRGKCYMLIHCSMDSV